MFLVTAVAWVWSLAWQFPHATGTAKKKTTTITIIQSTTEEHFQGSLPARSVFQAASIHWFNKYWLSDYCGPRASRAGSHSQLGSSGSPRNTAQQFGSERRFWERWWLRRGTRPSHLLVCGFSVDCYLLRKELFMSWSLGKSFCLLHALLRMWC